MVVGTELALTIVYIITVYYVIFLLTTLFSSKSHEKKALTKLPLVSVIIPAYNEEAVIAESAESVLNLDYPKDKLQLILVNDGSKDNTWKEMQKFKRKYKDRNVLLINQENHGKWYAMNAGIKVAKGEFFAGLDADSFVRSDALKKLLPYFTEEDIAVVLPLLKIKNPRNILQRLQWYEYIINMFYKRITSRISCIHVAPGPFSVYRTEIIRKIGCFRQAHQTEDLEIALRLQHSNYKIIQTFDAEAYTYGPSSLKELYRQRNRWHKGSFLNVIDYRHMLFNREYGDFGVFLLPVVLISGLLILTVVSITLYTSLIRPLYHTFAKLSLVNFDIYTLMKGISFNFNVLDLNFFKMMIMLSAFALSLFILIKAHRQARENAFKYGIFSLIIYSFIYYLLLGVVWFGILKDFLLRRKAAW